MSNLSFVVLMNYLTWSTIAGCVYWLSETPACLTYTNLNRQGKGIILLTTFPVIMTLQLSLYLKILWNYYCVKRAGNT